MKVEILGIKIDNLGPDEAEKYIIERIAELKNSDFQKIAEITTENAKKLFRI